MKAKYRKSGYKCNEVEELISFSWAYIDSDTEKELATNRTALLSALKLTEQGHPMRIVLDRTGRYEVSYSPAIPRSRKHRWFTSKDGI
jgi:hypothetical protein